MRARPPLVLLIGLAACHGAKEARPPARTASPGASLERVSETAATDRGSSRVSAAHDAPARAARPPEPVSPRPPSSAPATALPPAPRARARAPERPGVRAGSADDNVAFHAWLRFLAQREHLGLRHDVSDRVVVAVTDEAGRPVQGATVRVTLGGQTLMTRQTFADGRALVFPSEDRRLRGRGVALEVSHGGRRARAALRGHAVTVQLPGARPEPSRVPLDVAFVLDTTGSMADELERLRQTIEVVHWQISHLEPRADVRFGLVLYRDVTDAYRAWHAPFTGDLQAFRRLLDGLDAAGGDDYPEDVQEGLRLMTQALEWRAEGVKLAFLIGDAPPHLDYGQAYTYVDAMREAASRGIKVATIGASGLDGAGEVVWRQIAQYTMAPFVFLTHGERGDSEGSPSTVSHHVGANWHAEDLDAIVVRLVKSELAHLSQRGAPARQDYFRAARSMTVPPAQVLEELFTRSVRQLVDYSVASIPARTPTVLLPARATRPAPQVTRVERRLALGLARHATFQLVDESAAVLEALAAQMSAHYDAAAAAEAGKRVPAELAVLASVEAPPDGPCEVLVKLVRIETGEVLSLSLLKIERGLLL